MDYASVTSGDVYTPDGYRERVPRPKDARYNHSVACESMAFYNKRIPRLESNFRLRGGEFLHIPYHGSTYKI